MDVRWRRPSTDWNGSHRNLCPSLTTSKPETLKSLGELLLRSMLRESGLKVAGGLAFAHEIVPFICAKGTFQIARDLEFPCSLIVAGPGE